MRTTRASIMGDLAKAAAMSKNDGATREEIDEMIDEVKNGLRHLADDESASPEDRKWARDNLEALGDDGEETKKAAARAQMSPAEREFLAKRDARARAARAPKRATMLGHALVMSPTMTQAEAAARAKELEAQLGNRR